MKAEEPPAEARPPWDIQDRTLEYALRAVRLFQALQEGRDRAGWIIGEQFLRAATSVGASVAEAQAGESRADFIHKYSIAQKEARECLYWLQLLARADLVKSDRLEPLVEETNEIIAVLTAIIVRTKREER